MDLVFKKLSEMHDGTAVLIAAYDGHDRLRYAIQPSVRHIS